MYTYNAETRLYRVVPHTEPMHPWPGCTHNRAVYIGAIVYTRLTSFSELLIASYMICLTNARRESVGPQVHLRSSDLIVILVGTFYSKFISFACVISWHQYFPKAYIVFTQFDRYTILIGFSHNLI